jgi:hypothetical protein
MVFNILAIYLICPILSKVLLTYILLTVYSIFNGLSDIIKHKLFFKKKPVGVGV